MTLGPVRASAVAVHTLGLAIARYAQCVQEVAESAQRSASAVERRMTGLKEQRRQELAVADQELQAARQALAQCQATPKAACGAQAAAVEHAVAKQQQARQAYQQASQAAVIVSAAARELAISIQSVEYVVAGQASAAAEALSDLEDRLRMMAAAYPAHAAWIRNVLTGLVVAAKITNTAVGPPVHDIRQAEHNDVVVAQLQQDYELEQQKLYGHSTLKRLEDRSDKFPPPFDNSTSQQEDGHEPR